MIPSALPAASLVESLVAVLAEMPPSGGRREADRAAARLDRLEYEARWQGADEGALAAIAGMRHLLGLTAAPTA